MTGSLRRTVYSVVFLVALSLAAAPSASAQVLYRGDANQDNRMDAGDVISLSIIQENPDASPPLRQRLADANGDGVLDASDLQLVLNVLLGTAVPIPLLQEYQGQPVSIYRPPTPPQAVETQTVQLGAVSFYFAPQPVTQGGENNTVVLGAVSYFYEPNTLRPVGEDDAVLLGATSYFFEPLSAPIAGQDNTVQLGAPSFYFEPISVLVGKEENTVELGAPSYERQ